MDPELFDIDNTFKVHVFSKGMTPQRVQGLADPYWTRWGFASARNIREFLTILFKEEPHFFEFVQNVRRLEGKERRPLVGISSDAVFQFFLHARPKGAQGNMTHIPVFLGDSVQVLLESMTQAIKEQRRVLAMNMSVFQTASPAAIASDEEIGSRRVSPGLDMRVQLYFEQSCLAPPSHYDPKPSHRLRWTRGVKAVASYPRGKKEIRFLAQKYGDMSDVRRVRYLGKVYWAKITSYPKDSYFDLVSPQARHLFVLQQKNIPGICIASHFLELEDGKRAVLFQPFPPGQTLWSKIKKGVKQLSVQEALTILLPVARTVGRLHAAGYFHWDLKPKNIWIADNGDIILFDFDLSFRNRADFLDRGIFRYTSSKFESQARLDAQIYPDKMPQYFPSMADETYALGKILITMLCGQSQRFVPRRDANAQLEMLDANASVSPAVKSLLQKAVADGESRYADIQDFINELEACRSMDTAEDSRGKGSPAAIASDEKIGLGRVSPELGAGAFPYPIARNGILDASLLHYNVEQIAAETEAAASSRLGIGVKLKAVLGGSAVYLSDDLGQVPLDLIGDIDIPYTYDFEVPGQDSQTQYDLEKDFANRLAIAFGQSPIGRLMRPTYNDKEPNWINYPPVPFLHDTLITHPSHDPQKMLKRYLCFEFYFGRLTGDESYRAFYLNILTKFMRGSVSPLELWDEVTRSKRWRLVREFLNRHYQMRPHRFNERYQKFLNRVLEDFVHRSPRANELRRKKLEEAEAGLNLRQRLIFDSAA